MASTSSSSDYRAAYSEASHAFLLKDWDTARRIVGDLLQKTEDNTLHDDELARKVWILQLTLLASSDINTADPTKAEQPLAQTYTRIQRYYAASASAQSTVLHPSLLVATSLAGIKLHQPHFVRRTLEDYFDALLCEDVDSSDALLNDSIVGMDTSNADLSLSGIAINGNGQSAQATTGSRQGWRKSLDRLARIYTVHLLGKSLGEWEEAKAWVAQQRCLEDAGVPIITEENAQSVLEELEDAKQAQDREREAQLAATREREAQSKAKADADRQRKMSDDSKKRKSTSPSSNSQASMSRTRPSSSAGHSQQTVQPSPSSSTSRHKPNLSVSTPSHPQETGFAALRTHLSSFLSVHSDTSSSPSSAPTLRHPSSSLQFLTLFLKRLAFSKLFNTILVFFLIVGAWRRRLGRSGSSGRTEVGRYWKKVGEKVLETVKMGGSLGYL